MIELDFKEYSEKVLAKIRDTQNILLATCAENHVTTRLVGQLLWEDEIIFSTGIGSYKVAQIKKNPNVAFYLDKLNIEAEASLWGHPEKHPAFESAYGEKYPQYVSKYGYTPEDVVVTAKIKKIQIYTYQGKACKDIIDFEAKRAYRIEL